MSVADPSLQWPDPIHGEQSQEANAKTIGERETYAYSHDRYVEHLEKIRKAVVADETYRARISRSKMLLEFWRSQESSRRAVGAVG